jgi:hypothetical protein
MLLSTAAIIWFLAPAPWSVVALLTLGVLGGAEHVAWFALNRRARA